MAGLSEGDQLGAGGVILLVDHGADLFELAVGEGCEEGDHAEALELARAVGVALDVAEGLEVEAGLGAAAAAAAAEEELGGGVAAGGELDRPGEEVRDGDRADGVGVFEEELRE